MHMDTMGTVEILNVQVGSPANKLCDVISPELFKTTKMLKFEPALFWCKKESDVEAEEEWEKNWSI